MSKSTIFISYSHKDAEWKELLLTHLGVLQVQSHLDFWTDDEIHAGEAWFEKIQEALNTASVAIFLVSADSLTSSFILQEEIAQLLRRRDKEGLFIFPVLVRPCAWDSVPWLARLQLRPRDGVPLSAGSRNEAEAHLTAIVKEIKAVLEKSAASETRPRQSPPQDATSSQPRTSQSEFSPSPPRTERQGWLSWFSLPRIRFTLSLSFGFAALVFAVVYLLPQQRNRLLEQSPATPSMQPPTRPPSPESVSKPFEQREETAVTVEPSAAQRQARPGQDMVEIPAGEFWMGCNEDVDQACNQDEKPGRLVYLDAYAIDPYEVTVADYQRCLDASACSAEGLTALNSCNWNERGHLNHPVNCVNWEQAQAYCQWAGKRLPTEAEWEKAARGTQKFVYPWGNEWDVSKANFLESKQGGTVLVGSYSTGVSPYGVYDLAGNVGEWVQDWYAKEYYDKAPVRNPRGSGHGELKVMRGGSWRQEAWGLRTSARLKSDPGGRHNGVGFRCAR